MKQVDIDNIKDLLTSVIAQVKASNLSQEDKDKRIEGLTQHLSKIKTVEVENKADLDQRRFFLSFTPEWFKWLGWIIIIGGLLWLREKSGSWLILIIIGASYANIGAYFEAYFFTLLDKHYSHPLITTTQRRSHLLSVLLGFLALVILVSLTLYISVLFGHFKLS